MASRPPLGVSLADVLGTASQPPQHSNGQIIAGILADALAGAAGQPGPSLAMWNRERQSAEENAQWGKRLMAQRLIEQQIPVRPEGTSSQQDYEFAKRNGFNGSFTDFLQYTHPPSPVTLPANATVEAAPTADGLPLVEKPEDAAKLPPGTRFKMPDGRIGTVPGGAGGNASGGFLGGPYPDIGPYHRY